MDNTVKDNPRYDFEDDTPRTRAFQVRQDAVENAVLPWMRAGFEVPLALATARWIDPSSNAEWNNDVADRLAQIVADGGSDEDEHSVLYDLVEMGGEEVIGLFEWVSKEGLESAEREAEQIIARLRSWPAVTSG